MFTILLALTVIFSDSAKTKPAFIPREAFNNPQKFGLTRAMIEQIDQEMQGALEARRDIDSDSACATAEPQPKGDIDAIGTIIEADEGWNVDERYVTTLARVKLTSGEEVLVEFPFGSMQLGRTLWCTGTDRVKEGNAITFNARRAATEPAHLICVSLPDHHGRNE